MRSAVAAILLGGLAVICCTGPLLIGAIAATALAARFSQSGYLLIAAVLIAFGGGFLWLRHRQVSARSCPPKAFNKTSEHE